MSTSTSSSLKDKLSELKQVTDEFDSIKNNEIILKYFSLSDKITSLQKDVSELKKKNEDEEYEEALKKRQPLVEQKQKKWNQLNYIIPHFCKFYARYSSGYYDYVNISPYFGGEVFYANCKHYGFF
jgi:hypothetical protein